MEIKKLSIIMILVIVVASFISAYEVGVNYDSGVSDCRGSETKCSGDLESVYICENGNWTRIGCTQNSKCDYINNEAKCVYDPNDSSTKFLIIPGILVLFLLIIIYFKVLKSKSVKHNKK